MVDTNIFERNYLCKKQDRICDVLLWDVLAELDCLLLPAHDLVEDVVPGRGLAHGAAVVRVGEGLAVLLGHLPEVALAGHKGHVLRLVLQFLENKLSLPPPAVSVCTDHFVLRHGVVGADLLEVLVALLGGDGAVPGLVLCPAVLPHHLPLLALLLPVVVRNCAVPGK